MTHSKNSVTKYLGKVDHVSSSFAYIVLVDKSMDDVFVATQHLQGALHGDQVEIALFPMVRGKKRRSGKVVAILVRKVTMLVGRLTTQAGQVHCIPDGRRLYPVLIPVAMTKGAKEGDKVSVKITDWSAREEKSIGEVTKVWGVSGDCATEASALLAQFELEASFEEALEAEVAKFPDQLPAEEVARRRNFCDVPTFTIDPVDAKDFDDALSVKTLPNGDCEIGIHIADVTYYVKEGTPLDEEALRRGTSTYLVGRVIPMLPERLSNDLCSLKPQVQRPAFSTVVTFDQQAKVKKVWIGETVIFSDKRFTYEEALEVLTEKKGPYLKELLLLHKLSEQLRKARMEAGAIRFESSDIRIELNEKQEPVAIKTKPSIATNHLIEEFMLLANRLVAKEMTRPQKDKRVRDPFICRTHDFPKTEKLDLFRSFVKQLGYNFGAKPEEVPHSFNEVLAKSMNTPHAHVIQTLAIRSMEQARYTTRKTSHFGLGFSHYTHFTSPIRRYPDLAIHRLVKHYLNKTAVTKRPYEVIAEHCSARERRAVEAERASISFHQVFYLQQFQGKIFEGTISSVTEWGLYVELLENKCEGMVRLADLSDDYYLFDPVRLQVKGRQHQRIFRMGDSITIRVKNCDLNRRNVDFVLVKALPK